MGILERISTILRANINDLLSRAEDPEKILNQTLMDMRQAQYEARMQVAEAIAEGKKLARDHAAEAQEAADWMSKAEQAVKAERDDLAREALRRRSSSQDLADGLKEQLDAHEAMVEHLKTQLRALDAKIDQAERKRQLLVAREKRVAAQEKVSGAMAKTDTRSAFEAFDRMEGKIETREDRAAARQELADELSLDDEFEALATDPEVDAELAALKQRLAGREEQA